MDSMQLFLKQANILIVDNSGLNVEILTKIFKQYGYNNIRNVPDRESALKNARESLPDIILININIQGMDGYEICKVLRSNDDLKEIPIIFISNYNDNLDKDKVFTIGGADYLISPFNFKEVIARIETQLKLRFISLKYKKVNNNKPYEVIQKINNELVKENCDLKNEVLKKNRQLEEITLELREFNIILEEEITERTKTEEALKESERQFRYSLQEAPVPIMLYTEDGQVKKINRTWTDITGYSIKDIPTISQWAEITDAFTSEIDNSNMEKLFNSENRQNDGENFVTTREGNILIWNFYSAYIGELQDGHKLFMRVAIDVTERKRVEELQKSVEEERKKIYEIEEYDRIKTEFFSNISHELRTPINVIFSALQMHEVKLKDYEVLNKSEDIYKYTRIMKQNCYRILRLVNNILDITKIDSGYFDINKQNVNIISLIENIALSVAYHIENKGISLIFDTEIEEKLIGCDLEKIERIILNLLSNAVKFTPSGGQIKVNIEDCDENICIRIKDTGRGIPEDKINSIFERFVQVDKSLTRDHEGSGIGLSLVKSLVDLYGGTISVESMVDCGTEFMIFIPCTLVDETTEEFSFCDPIGKNCIEKINIEFSDIYI